MSISTRIQDLAVRVATEIKSVRTLVNGNVADLSALTTTTKTNLVAAINELDAAIEAVGGSSAGIADGTTTTATTWSSQKITDAITAAKADLLNGAPGALDTLDELAAALGDDANFGATVTTALSNRVRFDAAQTLTGPEQTQARANIGAGTGNSNVVIGTGAGQAADAGAVATSLAGKADTSHTHTTAQVTGLDTALSGKANTSHTHTASQISDATTVGRSVLTATDAAAARTAIGAVASADIGNTDIDLVAAFEAGL